MTENTIITRDKIKNTQEIGCVTNVDQLFSDRINALLRFDSAIGPSTIPNTKGAPGYPNFFIPKPKIPKQIAINTSNRLFELLKAPTIHSAAIIGSNTV